jgi:hypothetical protein
LLRTEPHKAFEPKHMTNTTRNSTSLATLLSQAHQGCTTMTNYMFRFLPTMTGGEMDNIQKRSYHFNGAV